MYTFTYSLLPLGRCEITGIDCSALNGQPLQALEIPDTITYNGKEYTVTSIGKEAMRLDKSTPNVNSLYFVESIKLPSQLVIIREGAFQKCVNLKHITFPDTLRVIESRAFNECSSLRMPDLPPALERIGNYVFVGTRRFPRRHEKDLVLPPTLKSVELFSFGQLLFNSIKADLKQWQLLFDRGTICYVKNFEPPMGIKRIPASAQSNNSHLLSVKLPSTCKVIGPRAFYACSHLKSIILPEGLERIEKSAFENSSVLDSDLRLPSTLEHIGDGAFGNCGGSSDVAIELAPIPLKGAARRRYLSSICIGPFENNSEVTIKGPKDAIARLARHPGAFNGLGVEAIELPEGTKEVYVESCPKLKTLTIPSSAKKIVSLAHCSALTKIVIPDSVESVGPSAFTSLRAPIEASVKVWKMLLSSYNALSKYRPLQLKIPEGITELPEKAIKDCRCLRLDLPTTLRTVCSKAIMNCPRLLTIHMPAATAIHPSPIIDCNALKTMEMPKTFEHVRDKILSKLHNSRSSMSRSDDSTFYSMLYIFLEITPEQASNATDTLEAALMLNDALMHHPERCRMSISNEDFDTGTYHMLEVSDEGKLVGSAPFNAPEWAKTVADLNAKHMAKEMTEEELEIAVQEALKDTFPSLCIRIPKEATASGERCILEFSAIIETTVTYDCHLPPNFFLELEDGRDSGLIFFADKIIAPGVACHHEWHPLSTIELTLGCPMSCRIHRMGDVEDLPDKSVESGTIKPAIIPSPGLKSLIESLYHVVALLN